MSTSASRKLPDGLRVVLISGGLPGDTRTALGDDSHLFERGPKESRTAFIARCVAVAKAKKMSKVVIGGLPPREV
jgi:hypothetical protein